MTTAEANEEARQINEDVQRDNGMLPPVQPEYHDSYGCGRRPCVARKYVTCKQCLEKIANTQAHGRRGSDVP